MWPSSAPWCSPCRHPHVCKLCSFCCCRFMKSSQVAHVFNIREHLQMLLSLPPGLQPVKVFQLYSSGPPSSPRHLFHGQILVPGTFLHSATFKGRRFLTIGLIFVNVTYNNRQWKSKLCLHHLKKTSLKVTFPEELLISCLFVRGVATCFSVKKSEMLHLTTLN